MKRTIIIITLFFLSAGAANSQLSRSITLPHTQTFDSYSDYSPYIKTECGGTVTDSPDGWSGRAMKITPPTSPCTGSGSNGGTNGLFWHNFTGTSRINIRFLMKFGPTINANWQGQNEIKFVEPNGSGGRVGMGGWYEESSFFAPGVYPWPSNWVVYRTPGTNTGDHNHANGPVQVYDGGAFSNVWFVYEYENNCADGTATTYITTSDGTQYTVTANPITCGENITTIRPPAGYFNGYASSNAGAYIMIDEMVISNTYIGPPDGFTGADIAAPTVSSASVNGSTATINFSESVVSTNYVAGDFNLDCTNPTASNVALSSPSGSGSSRTFSLASPVVYGQTCNLDYLGRTNGIEDAAGNDLAAREDITISNTTPDTTAPTVSGALPTGEQECTSDPRNVTMSVTTSEDATCRYSSSNVAYGSMSNFSTTGGTSHSTILSGLSCGSSYTLYVLCADSSANISSPVTTIDWSIASQYAPRGITGTGIIKMGSIH